MRGRKAKRTVLEVLAATLLAVLLLGISMLGDFLAKKVVLPVMKLEAGGNTAVYTVRTGELTVYLVGLGTYEAREEAAGAASLLLASGGTGLAAAVPEGYTAALSVYATGEAAESVKSKLRSAGCAASVWPMTAPACRLRVSAASSGAEKVDSAFQAFYCVTRDTAALCTAADTGEKTREEARTAVRESAEKLALCLGELDTLESSGEWLARLKESLSVSITVLSEVPASLDAAFPAGLKAAALRLWQTYDTLAKAVTE